MEDHQQILSDGDSPNPNGGGEHSKPDANPVINSDILRLFDPITYLRVLRKACGDTREYTDKQQEFVRDCRVVATDGKSWSSREDIHVALAAVNGSGKTLIIAELIRYWLDTIPGCMVVYTSKIARQGEMLKAYFDAQTARFPDWKCVEGKLTAYNGNVCRWFATDSPGAVESFHADYLIRVLDEVKSMDDAIVDATNRWHPKMSVYVSSKGLMSGRFFECFTKNRERWSCHEWSAQDCPWMSESFLEQVREECGANSPTFKSMVSNEWSDVGVRNLITLEAVERCRKNAVGWIGGEIVAGIDPSAARKEGDEFVIYYRDGNRIYEPIIIQDCSTPLEAVAAAIRECKRINAKIINMDKGGIGLIMYNMFEEQLKGDQSIRLNGINFGGATLTKSEAYANRAMEMAAALSRQIELHQLILPKDPKTISQLVTRQWTPTESGKMKLLSKELMRREGFRSPDRFDALMLCVQGEIPTQASLTGWRSNPFADPNFLAEEDDKHSQINHSYEGIDFGR